MVLNANPNDVKAHLRGNFFVLFFFLFVLHSFVMMTLVRSWESLSSKGGDASVAATYQPCLGEDAFVFGFLAHFSVPPPPHGF